jgi:hypothetical protein
MGQAKISGKNGVAPTFEKLPLFNTDQIQFPPDATKREPTKVFFECEHVVKHRKDPDSDLFGYCVKIQLKGGCGFFKLCETCAHKMNTPEVVARCQYNILSAATAKMMLKNPDPHVTSVSLSDYAKQLDAEVAAEGPDTIN